LQEGGREGGRKEEGSKKGRKKTEKDRELWKDTHTDARLVMGEQTEHRVQTPGSYPLVYVNKKIF